MSQNTWRAQAKCKGLDTAIFFPSNEAGIEAAKAICRSCEVQSQCLDWALSTRQDEGVWGGLSDDERYKLRRRRRRHRRED